MKAAVAVATVLGVLGAGVTRTHAEPDPPARSLVVLSSAGQSFALGGRRAANVAPPSIEARLAWTTSWPRRLTIDGSLIGYAYPETVVAAGVGARVHPLADVRAARAWYVRAATQTLLARGTDVAISAESGAALEHARLIAWLGAGVDRFLVHPRAVVQIKVGFGVTF